MPFLGAIQTNSRKIKEKFKRKDITDQKKMLTTGFCCNSKVQHPLPKKKIKLKITKKKKKIEIDRER